MYSRRLIASLLSALAFVVPWPAAAQAPAASPPPQPRLVIAISVDQFANHLFERYLPDFTGGLHRLANGYRFVGYQSHAATETCPGHSTLMSGMHPSETGIVANTWFDVKTGSSIYCVSVDGTSDEQARGPQRMRVDTLGAWLKASGPVGSRAISVSGKDRAAIMMAGKHADAVYWWVDGLGFLTSSYAGPDTPAIEAPAKAFNAATFAAWKQHPPVLWPAAAPAQCAALQKPYRFGDEQMSGRVPPDQATGLTDNPAFMDTTAFQDQLRSSTLFDQLTLDYATQLIDHPPVGTAPLGEGPGTDLLTISLSSTDYVGHRFGPGGAEMCTHLIDLDQALGRFFDHLDAMHVAYMVVLTADHGDMDAAERARDNGFPDAKRIDTRQLVDDLNQHLRDTMAITYDPIDGSDPQQLKLNVPPSADAAFRARIEAEAMSWLKAQPDKVADVFTRAQIVATPNPTGTPAPQLTLLQRYRESYDPERSGDLIVTYPEHATLGWPRGVGDTVAGHGSPWDYDRRVPILFWWPGVTPSVPATPIETVDIAPTLASIIHVPTPPLDGHCVDLGQGCAAH